MDGQTFAFSKPSRLHKHNWELGMTCPAWFGEACSTSTCARQGCVSACHLSSFSCVMGVGGGWCLLARTHTIFDPLILCPIVLLWCEQHYTPDYGTSTPATATFAPSPIGISHICCTCIGRAKGGDTMCYCSRVVVYSKGRELSQLPLLPLASDAQHRSMVTRGRQRQRLSTN